MWDWGLEKGEIRIGEGGRERGSGGLGEVAGVAELGDQESFA